MLNDDAIRWTPNSTNYLVLGYDDETEDGEALRNVLDDTYPEDATVTVTVKNRLGTAVTGATNLTMSHVAGTTGDGTQYRAEVPHTVSLPVGNYTAVALAIKSGKRKEFKKRIIVGYEV